MKLNTLISIIESIAPPDMAESWDNVGLLLQPKKNPDIKKLLLTIDLTEEVMSEATRGRYDMILAYHPPIFDAFKRLGQDRAKERIILKAITSGISVYSPHTALDAAPDGVNDWLASGMGEGEVYPTLVDGDVSVGRVVKLDKPIQLNTLMQRIRKHLKLKGLRCARVDSKKPIETVALCAGAGISAINQTRADVYFTGEMRHHDVLEAKARGVHVILCEHTHTERAYLPVLKRRLKQQLGTEIVIELAKSDKEPIVSV